MTIFGLPERPCESVLVLVDDEEGVDLFDLVAKNVHDLIHELSVVRVLEARSVRHSHIGTLAKKPFISGKMSQSKTFWAVVGLFDLFMS